MRDSSKVQCYCRSICLGGPPPLGGTGQQEQHTWCSKSQAKRPPGKGFTSMHRPPATCYYWPGLRHQKPGKASRKGQAWWPSTCALFVFPHSHINVFEFRGVQRKERYVLESQVAGVVILVATHAWYLSDVGSTCCEYCTKFGGDWRRDTSIFFSRDTLATISTDTEKIMWNVDIA